MSTQSLSYRFATELETNIFAKILDCLKQGVYATFNSDARDVKRGERAIRNYKKGMPIPFAWSDSLRIETEGSEFYLRWYNGLRFHLTFGGDCLIRERPRDRQGWQLDLKIQHDFAEFSWRD